MANSKILIHQLSTEFWGKYNDLLDEVENSKELMETIRGIYKAKTWMSTKTVNALISKETHMNANIALSNGFVDEIW